MAKDTYRTERLQLMLDEKELEAIEEWRFENRIPTRAAAIRELLRRGLLHEKAEIPEDATKSTDFTVLPDADAVSPD
ncbi:MAG: hypothetical protein ACE363_08935 [Alphaproteobacteria bacterium]